MGQFARDTIEHLKEVSWAVFLLCIVLAGLTLVFGRHLGYAPMAWICLGFALLLIVVFGTIFAINLIGVVAILSIKRLGRQKGLL